MGDALLRDTISPGSEIAQSSIDLYADSTPEYESRVSATWNPRPNWQVFSAVRHSSSTPEATIPSHTGFDLRLAWKVHPYWEMSIVGQDLLDTRHREFADAFSRQSEPNIGRSAFLRLTFER
ncbi:MAG: TonB-dependent receptor [Candidatus Synoicihabitans palmerolidicus]|nr:TonB-dependent receptor [Candidatus Synoicihabitans palmerolidicus]